MREHLKVVSAPKAGRKAPRGLRAASKTERLVRLTSYVVPDLKRRLQAAADEDHRTLSNMVCWLSHCAMQRIAAGEALGIAARHSTTGRLPSRHLRAVNSKLSA